MGPNSEVWGGTKESTFLKFFFFFFNWERSYTYRNGHKTNVYQNRLVKSKYPNIPDLELSTENTLVALTILISLSTKGNNYADFYGNHFLIYFWALWKLNLLYVFFDPASFTKHGMRILSMWSHVTVVCSFHCCKVFHYMIAPQWSNLLLLENWIIFDYCE